MLFNWAKRRGAGPLADTSSDKHALLGWLHPACAKAECDSPAGHAIQAAARQLAKVLDSLG